MPLLLLTVLFLALAPGRPAAQLAADYPHDEGIENDPDVYYVEKFDDGLDQIFSRYTDILFPGGIELDHDVPPGSLGPYSLRMNSTPGVNTGAHLFRNFQPGFDGTVHVRYYVKYPSSSKNYFHHEAIWFGGYNPATPWPNPGAGLCGMGDKRLSIAFEPVWHDTDPPGMDTYLYWGDMRSWNNGTSCFGNVLVTQGATEYDEPLAVGDYPALALDEWMCVEVMIKLNDPVSAYNGELAIWLDGEPVGHWGPGFPNGHWLKDKWYNNPNDPPFEGFRWRTNPALNINWIWIEYFHSNPAAPPSHILYDHLVVANRYIGPIHMPSSTEETSPDRTNPLRVFPNPVPAGQPLHLQWGTPETKGSETRIAISDLAGRIVHTSRQSPASGTMTLTLPRLAPGVYVLKMEDDRQVRWEHFLVTD